MIIRIVVLCDLLFYLSLPRSRAEPLALFDQTLSLSLPLWVYAAKQLSSGTCEVNLPLA